jgi:hypothetical protein
MWSSAARKYQVKLQLAQNRAAHLSLHCNQRADINTMHGSLSWLRVEERLTATILLFIRNKIPNGLHSQFTHSSDTHLPHQACHQGSIHSPQIQNKFKNTHTVLHRAIIEWNSIPSHIAQINSKTGFKKQIKQHLAAQHLSCIILIYIIITMT